MQIDAGSNSRQTMSANNIKELGPVSPRDGHIAKTDMNSSKQNTLALSGLGVRKGRNLRKMAIKLGVEHHSSEQNKSIQ